ncbi:MAG: Gfo/Idh/MocA family oxidoreductase [Armatimonadetes bacterium]|nr:Gfo/Idh/MocA family oxidoreductase [Armatimonadota bacterium]
MPDKRLMLIGAGALGRQRAQCFRRIAGVQLVAVASRSQDSALRLAEEVGAPFAGTDPERMADQKPLDAVAICAPNDRHYPLIKWALQRNLHVFVEGPMCNTARQAEELNNLAIERQLIVEVGFQRRYHPVIRRARDMVQSGGMGQFTYGEVEFFYNILADSAGGDPWYVDQEVSGGMCVCHMSYGLNTLRYILGDPVEVFAVANNFAFRGPGHLTEEAVAALLMYRSGAVAHIVAGFAAPPGFPTGTLKAYGTTGGFTLQILDPPYGTFYAGGSQDEMPNPPGSDDLHDQCLAFVEALHGRGELLNPPADSWRELRIIEGILQSAKLRRPIAVP